LGNTTLSKICHLKTVKHEENKMKLYDLEPSGNCYKVRLFCALAGIPIALYATDFMAGEHKTPKFMAMNPLGEVPILDDDGFILRDSQAILVYLASKYGGETWLPKDPANAAKVMQWLSTAANEVQHGPGDARLVDLFGYKWVASPLPTSLATLILGCRTKVAFHLKLTQIFMLGLVESNPCQVIFQCRAFNYLAIKT
jgi:glutathione S-transferase